MTHIPAWRLALTCGALVILTAVGVGLVTASNGPTSPAAAPLAGAPSAGPSSGPGGRNGSTAHPVLRRLVRRLANRPAIRRLVDGQLTFTDRTGALVTLQLDHGTIHALGGGTLTIDEAGGSQVTVATNGDTVVRLGGGEKGSLGDLKVGDEVVVQSRVDGGSAVAKHVLRVPAASSAPEASPGSGA